jgi:hypothetical protein
LIDINEPAAKFVHPCAINGIVSSRVMNRRHLLLGASATAAVGTGLYLAGRGPSYPQAVAPIRAEIAERSDADMPYLVHHAVLAANSHNTQPWLFRTGLRHL